MQNKIKQILESSNDKSQVLQAVEELAELSQALIKNVNRNKDNIDDITQEMADVFIMLEQLKLIYKIDDQELKKQMEFKVNR
ncbi:nucleoside triphosphate pyrophosphohydrolase family protein [Mycoplasma marinum]|uniref:NTP pyrophosphohydrolase MazG putative catalytic core domain-containing protein n=2 Tax=Mycoplasma marinum TaxID=1937190 RepID=A0A4R0XVL5_9MOLU|nr:hypothetical protein [Mycoplasma marinum]TCG10981.1 hypothetical protein C4B24_03400 [Mycoplasma marinum]